MLLGQGSNQAHAACGIAVAPMAEEEPGQFRSIEARGLDVAEHHASFLQLIMSPAS